MTIEEKQKNIIELKQKIVKKMRKKTEITELKQIAENIVTKLEEMENIEEADFVELIKLQANYSAKFLEIFRKEEALNVIFELLEV